jgi:hypothetical protein
MDAFLVLILSHFNQLYLDAIEFLKRDILKRILIFLNIQFKKSKTKKELLKILPIIKTSTLRRL